uniref:Uncharacterized protein n=1 Tax=Malurus cyaneus samueli TaxID=2593467 RepID=A0A8C5TAB7_9PASS
MRIAQTHHSNISRSLQTPSLPSSVSTAPHSSMLLANLPRVHSIPLSMLLTKTLKVLVPIPSPEECHMSLLSTWTLRLQLLGCDHPASLLPTRWLIFQIPFSPV